MGAKRNTAEAAKRVGVRPRTMEQWRWLGRGPKFLKVGGVVRYDDEDLDAFLAGCVRTSTSDRGPEDQTAA
jgi:hypothetical protein